MEYNPNCVILQPKEIILHEVQYDNSGNVIFTGKSEIDFITRMKVNELEANGQKQEEYYFILPLR